MRELVPDIHAWTWFSDRFGYDFSGWLVEHAGGNVAVDPVEMDAATLDELGRRGVARIALTNRNHFRAAARLRERTGARVAVHPADAEFVRQKGVVVDDPLQPGDAIGPFRAVAAAGKSPGEVALYWPERRLLLVGDACVGPAPGRLGLLPEAAIDDLAALRASLRRIADEVDFDTLLLADGHSILRGGREALRALVATFPG
jgi:glyoxylase-like metal-dependent hydrolase (beta-lactamase superfamily II)